MRYQDPAWKGLRLRAHSILPYMPGLANCKLHGTSRVTPAKWESHQS